METDDNKIDQEDNNLKFRTNKKKDIALLLKKIVLFLILCLIVPILMNAILQLFQMQFDFVRLFKHIFETKTELFFLGSAILLIFYLWLTSLLGNYWVGLTVMLIVTVSTGIANQQKLIFRSEPLYPSDFSMITDLPFLVDMIDIKLVIIMILFIVVSIVFCIWLYKKQKKNIQPFNKKIIGFIRILVLLSTSGMLFYIFQFNQSNNYIRESFYEYAYWTSFSQEVNYDSNGFIPGFLYNLNAPAVEEPQEYSKDNIDSISQKYEKKANEINQTRQGNLDETNIIFIMNESFSDPYALEGMTISDDPIPEIRKQMKNHLAGKVLSQGYGGGTANIEFEALTGISMEPMASSITTPFTQLTTKIKDFPSVPSYLSEKGFATTAIHPFNTSMYKRKEVYTNMGFDTFLSDSTMRYTAKIDQNNYISDQSAYKEVLDQLENSEENDFVHLVTMQNHMDYTGKYPNTEFKAEGSANDMEAINYYQDINNSDKSLKEFLAKIEKFSENSIVVFWGDHLPGFYGNEIMSKNGTVKMHETPLLIYANFKTRANYIDTISPIYFMNYILEKTDSSVTPYYALLYELEDKLPAFEKGVYLENGSEEMLSKREDLSPETLELLEDYDNVIYDVTTGENYLDEYNFFE
ncbi:LTA synthase family protein [Carnobacterium alterfunditum]|uniref:LTA synthase family protein n=1 Tax=Carnobacterium alterfunditum TaxID=28230 RepID=UPI003593F866